MRELALAPAEGDCAEQSAVLRHGGRPSAVAEPPFANPPFEAVSAFHAPSEGVEVVALKVPQGQPAL